MTTGQCVIRMFRYMKPYSIKYGLGTLLYSIQQFASAFVNSLFMGWITAAVLSMNIAGVINSVFLMALMVIFIMVIVGTGTYLYIVTVAYALRDVSMDVFKAFRQSSVESQKHSGEGLAMVNTDVNTSTNILSDALTPFLQNILAIGLSVTMVFIIDVRMGFGVFVVGLLALFIQTKYAKPLAVLGKEQLEANTESVKSLSNILSGALAIRAYNRQSSSLMSFNRETGKLQKIAFKRAFIGMWQDLFTTIQGWLTMVVVFDSVSNEEQKSGKYHANAINGNLVLNKISFSYKDMSAKVLDTILLTIPKNQMIAFVGESGSGKSTLLRTIIGMYERDDLDMTIGSVHYSKAEIDLWRSHFAYVDQSYKLFDMSIAQNIAMGKQGKAERNEVEEAATKALAHHFVSELSEGYDTGIGEKGSTLSAGQKQRIAIARALCKKAPVLVFDEATAALDSSSERGIMETIDSLRHNHTILIATHNLHSIETADMIVVMEKGRIVETGTHSDLMKNGNMYKRLRAEATTQSGTKE